MKTFSEKTKDNIIKLLLGTIILLGLIFDVFSIKVLLVNDFKDIVLTLFQVHATIVTLAIALISIISSSISKNVYGISVSNFFMNLSRSFFTQKKIIYLELLMIGIDFFAYIFRLYNTMCALFIIALILIFLLSQNVFMIFSGKVFINNKIKQYLLETILSDDIQDLDKRCNLISGFLDYFNENSEKFSICEYEDYFKALIEVEKIIFNKYPDADFKVLVYSIHEVFKTALNSKSIYKLNICIEYMWQTYLVFSLYREKTDWKDIEFNLFSNIYKEIEKNIQSDNKEFLYYNMLLKNLPEGILICGVYKINGEFYLSYDVSALFQFMYNMGYLLRSSNVTINFKSYILPFFGDDSRGILGFDMLKDIEIQKKVYEYKISCQVSFVIGLINNYYESEVSEYLFNNLKFITDNEYNHEYAISIIIFLYYIGVKLRCKYVINGSDNSEFIRGLLLKNILDIHFYLSNKFPVQGNIKVIFDVSKKCLAEFNYIPEDYNEIKLTENIESVAREFFIFILTVNNEQINYKEKMRELVKDNVYMFYYELVLSNKEKTKISLSAFYGLFVNIDEKNLDNVINNYYALLEKTLREINVEVKNKF